MKVLVLTPYLPHRRVGHGGGTAVRDLVRCLAERHEVRVVSLLRPHERPLVAEVEELGASVVALPFLDRSGDSARLALATARTLAAGRSLASGYPHYVQKYWSRDLSRGFLAAVDEFAPDAVQIEYLQLSLLARDLWRRRNERDEPGPRLLINSHELGSLPRERRARRARNPRARALALREAASWRRLQVAASGWCDRMLCVTPGDRDLYAAMGGRNLVHVPLGMDVRSVTAVWDPQPPDRFLFVGSFAHRPNRLAAEFLVRRVWPAVAAELPTARLVLAGHGSRQFLASITGAGDATFRGVEALGFVEDLEPLFRESRLFVAPLPEGGGIKIKVLEAMARGIPVVTSSVGAEGIADQDDSPLYLAECDEGFAAKILQATRDPQSGERAARARRLIEEEFGWPSIVERLTALYEGADDPDGDHP